MPWTTFSYFGHVLVITLLLAGCTSTQLELPDSHEHIPNLLDGSAVFGEPVPAAPVEDLLALSPEMEDFIETAEINKTRISYTRFRRLMKGLLKGGYFNNHYEESGTYSASKTFSGAKGNCLGYTNMFIALARAANLDAKYQLIESSPLFDVEAGQLIRNNHINVIVDHLDLPGEYSAKVVVDFNIVQPDPEHAKPTIVSDTFAEALFYVNLSADAQAQGKLREAFAYLKRAALTDETNYFLWNNLGVFYSRMGEVDLAEQAYQVALSHDKNNKSALVGLVVTYTNQGRHAEAAVLERKVYSYQKRNPYFHYAMADKAFRAEKYNEALVAIEEAIDLRGNDARFFALRAATAAELGDEKLQHRSENLARKYAEREARKDKPNAKVYGKYEAVRG